MINCDASPNSLIQQYAQDLISSGRDDAEIVDGLEQYYSKLASGFDNEFTYFQTQLAVHQAAARELEA